MQHALTYNIQHFSHGTSPLVDPIADMNIRPDMAGNSWFWVGRLESKGHMLNFMYHVSVLQLSKHLPTKMINSVLSITDETKIIYRHEDRFYKARSGEVAKEGLSIRTSQDIVEGDLDMMHIATSMESGSVDLTLRGTGYPLFNLCTGYFDIAGLPNYQYSFPHMKATGMLTLDGTQYPIDGMVWLDRQFAGRPKGRKLENGYNCKWVWMNLLFDNHPDSISLFGVTNLETKKENCWATVLHANGTQSGAGVDPMIQNSFDVWESPQTGMRYPTGWKVAIPEWDTQLTVKSILDEQEIAAKNAAGRKYEAASSVLGKHKGQEVTGHCCLELVGGWTD